MSKPNQPKSQIDRLRSSFHGSRKEKDLSSVDPSTDFNSEEQFSEQPGSKPESTVENVSSENDGSSSNSLEDPSNTDLKSETKKRVKKQSLLGSFLSSSSSSKKKKSAKGKASNDAAAAQEVKQEPENPDEKMLGALKKEQKRIKGKKNYWKTLVNTICVLVLICSISVLAATLWLPFLKVYTNNMAPAINKDDIVMVVKQNHLAPGELIGFYYNNKLMIKRVIAQAGDVVDIDDNGIVYVNGSPLDEPYVSNQQRGDASIDFPYTVPEAQLFVLSDDRSNLLDSRNYAIQSIAEELILGKIALRVWPLSDLQIF